MSNVIARARFIASRVYDRLFARPFNRIFLAPRGHGLRLRKDVWEAGYRRKEWPFFNTAGVLGPYMMIAGYVRYLHPGASILEVGCGHGVLLEVLAATGFRSYCGIDLSEKATEEARARGVSNARVETADFETWEPQERFDIIIFNESIYYARRPTDLLLRYAEALNENGSLIVSMHRSGNHATIWAMLEKHFSVLHRTALENQDEQAWDVKVLRRRE